MLTTTQSDPLVSLVSLHSNTCDETVLAKAESDLSAAISDGGEDNMSWSESTART